MKKQTLPPATSTSLTPSKKWGRNETLSVIFLVLFPLIGIILMWASANWPTKVKVIATIWIFLFPGIVVSVISMIMGGISAVILLLPMVLSIIGIILMWMIAKWSTKTKIIVTVVLPLLSFIFPLILAFLFRDYLVNLIR